jgi:hypothetical protein
MATRLKVRGIAERALRKIGAFAINDTAADPAELAETLYWMDMVVAELAGTERCQWLIPATLEIPLTTDTFEYPLTNAGADYPDDGVLFVCMATIRDANGQDTEIEMQSRASREAIGIKTTGGVPTHVHVDRLVDTPTAFVYPVPQDDTLTLRLICQIMSPNLVGAGSSRLGNKDHGLPMEWQKWLVNATAAEIGSGPVRRLPKTEVDDIRASAAASKSALMAYSNREKQLLRRTVAWDA